jgi:hypothetical protein
MAQSIGNTRPSAHAAVGRQLISLLGSASRARSRFTPMSLWPSVQIHHRIPAGGEVILLDPDSEKLEGLTATLDTDHTRTLRPVAKHSIAWCSSSSASPSASHPPGRIVRGREHTAFWPILPSIRNCSLVAPDAVACRCIRCRGLGLPGCPNWPGELLQVAIGSQPTILFAPLVGLKWAGLASEL